MGGVDIQTSISFLVHVHAGKRVYACVQSGSMLALNSDKNLFIQASLHKIVCMYMYIQCTCICILLKFNAEANSMQCRPSLATTTI